MARPAERKWSIAGREREEWDAGTLAQLVLALARTRIADRLKKTTSNTPKESSSKGAAA